MSSDNVLHPMHVCSRCHYFADDGSHITGDCVKNPPTMVVTPVPVQRGGLVKARGNAVERTMTMAPTAAFPPTRKDMTCGEWTAIGQGESRHVIVPQEAYNESNASHGQESA